MIIDSHTHILPPDIIKRKEYYLQKDSTFFALFASKNSAMATVETLIATMDQHGISSSAVLGMGWQDGLNFSFVLPVFWDLRPQTGDKRFEHESKCHCDYCDGRNVEYSDH